MRGRCVCEEVANIEREREEERVSETPPSECMVGAI